MRRSLVVLLGALLLAGLVGSAGAAPRPAEPVRLGPCVNGSGGVVRVAPNQPVTIAFGWSALSRGRLQDFMNLKTFKAAVNGVPVSDVDSYWGDLFIDETGAWRVEWVYPTGLEASNSAPITVTFSLYFSHQFQEPGEDPLGPGYVIFGPEATCTIR